MSEIAGVSFCWWCLLRVAGEPPLQLQLHDCSGTVDTRCGACPSPPSACPSRLQFGSGPLGTGVCVGRGVEGECTWRCMQLSLMCPMACPQCTHGLDCWRGHTHSPQWRNPVGMW